MTPDLVCGIDPGQSGGIAILTLAGEIVGAWPMPETEAEVCEIMAEFGPRCLVAALERVTPMRGQGLGSTWSFGQNYGFLRGVLAALQIRREFVRPQVWQPALGIAKRGDKTQTEHKNATKSKAQELFPKQKITHAIADALLIAEWARRTQCYRVERIREAG